MSWFKRKPDVSDLQPALGRALSRQAELEEENTALVEAAAVMAEAHKRAYRQQRVTIERLKAEAVQLREQYDDSQTWHRHWMERAEELETQLADANTTMRTGVAALAEAHTNLGIARDDCRHMARDLAAERVRVEDLQARWQKWQPHFDACPIAQKVAEHDADKAVSNQ